MLNNANSASTQCGSKAVESDQAGEESLITMGASSDGVEGGWGSGGGPVMFGWHESAFLHASAFAEHVFYTVCMCRR